MSIQLKYAICALLALIICAASLVAFAAEGGEFTSDLELAQKLDEIFAGEAKLFTNTSKGYPIDSYIGGGTFVVDGRVSGSECYIYANAVYFYLFGEIPEHGTGTYLSGSIALKGCKEASYEVFKQAGVSVGTYIRTTTNKDASYNKSAGHSLIVLSYDEDGVTWLDANWGTERYYVHLNTHDWKYFNKYVLKDARIISHALIPYATSISNALYDGKGIVYDLDELGIARAIRIPSNIDTIGDGAFDCENDTALVLTAGVTDIGRDALGNAVIFAPEGSAAQLYATQNNLTFYPIYEGWRLNAGASDVN